jgi:hypothetical protein
MCAREPFHTKATTTTVLRPTREQPFHIKMLIREFFVQALEFVVLESSGGGVAAPVAQCPLPLSPLIAAHRSALRTQAQAPSDTQPASYALFTDFLSAPPKAAAMLVKAAATGLGVPWPQAPRQRNAAARKTHGSTCMQNDRISSLSRGSATLCKKCYTSMPSVP